MSEDMNEQGTANEWMIHKFMNEWIMSERANELVNERTL